MLSKALRNLQKLYNTNGIINIFDSTLEAEALGCEVTWKANGPVIIGHPFTEGKPSQILPHSILDKGRIPVVLDATRQLKITIGNAIPVGAVITGPIAITSNLVGQDITNLLEKDPKTANNLIKMVSKVIVELCKQYCEIGVDFIVLADENLWKLDQSYIVELSKYLRSFNNVARYYDIPTIILTKKLHNAAILEKICTLNSDGIVLSQLTNNILECVTNLNKEIIGIGLPLEIIFANKGDAEDTISQTINLASEITLKMFLTTEWEIPCEASVDDVMRFMRIVNKYARNYFGDIPLNFTT